MNSFRQCFQNQDLEKKFQNYILKQAIKSFLRYQTLMIMVIAILLIGQIVKQNKIMIIWFIVVLALQTSAFVAAFKWPLFYNNIRHYYKSLQIIIATLQIFYYKFTFLNLEQNDMIIYMDILLYNIFYFSYKLFQQLTQDLIIQNPLQSLYILLPLEFIYKFPNWHLQLTQQVDPILQLINISKRKFKENYSLNHKEINEFMDDQVVILEKDEEKVSFSTKILNNKLPEICNEFNLFLKNVSIPQYKSKLQNYLYKSTYQNEQLVCSYKNQTYEVTYKVFILKKQQIFIRIKILDQYIKQLVNYKDLYGYLIKNLTFKPNQQYKGKNIMKSLQFSSFYYQFSRYSLFYRLEIQKISYEYFKYLFDKFKMSVNVENNNKISFHSDKKLLRLLTNLISNIMAEKVITIKIEQQMIEIQFYVNQDVKKNYLIEINKVLYHIGYGQLEEKQLVNSKQLSMVILDKDGLERFQ